MVKKSLKNGLKLFVLGALLGPWADHFHTQAGVLAYYDTVVFNMAWWVPLLFGLATVIIGFSHLSLDDRFAMQPKPKNGLDVVWGLLFFLVVYKLSALLPESFIKLILLGFLSLATWYFLDRRVLGLVQALLTAAAGCLVESSLSHAKLFYYTNPDFLGVPFWLPFLYVAASVAVGNLARKWAY